MNGDFTTTDLIERIRGYQYQVDHPELLKSHHFVFDCPLDRTHRGWPRFVWMGINPGDDDGDWARLPENSEESRDCDFQVVHGRSAGSKERLDRLEAFVGPAVFQAMTHSQWFFWGSKNAGKCFKARYGYSLRANPHWTFCCEMNRELIARARPVAVMAEGRWIAKLNARGLGLQRGPEHKSADGEILIEEWRFESDVPFYTFDHLSALGKSIPLRPKVRELLADLLQDAMAAHSDWRSAVR